MMQVKIDAKKRSEALKKGSFFSFIPKRLIISQRPELKNFPLNVLFASFKMEKGTNLMGSVLYEPDLSTFKKDGEIFSLTYRNSLGGNSQVIISYDTLRKRWSGEKFVNNKPFSVTDGKDWKGFFIHLTMLGLANGEMCEFKNIEENKDKQI